MNQLLRACLRLLRPSNFLIAVASVFVSCLLAGGGWGDLAAMVTSALAAGCIGAGGMVVNDLFDVAIDRINRPERPLPHGDITSRAAATFYAGLCGAGLLLNLFLPRLCGLIAIVAVFSLFFYSYRLKRLPLIGNLTVATFTGLAFIYGGAAVGNVEKAVIPALFAFLINAGREVVKDMEDVEGDARHGASTIPVRFGMGAGAWVATVFLSVVILSTFYPYLAGLYSVRYFVLVMAGVNTVIVYVLVSLWRNRVTENLRRLSLILKYDMIVGLAAIYLQ